MVKKISNDTKKSTSQIDFCASDKFAKSIIANPKWTMLKFALTVYVIAMSSSVLLAYFGGRLFADRNSTYVNLSTDFFYFLTELLVPLVWGYYYWIYKTPQDVFHALQQGKIVRLNEKDINGAMSILGNTIPTMLSLILGIAVGGLYYYQGVKIPSIWFNTNSFILAIRSFGIIAPTAYAAWSISFRLIVNAQVFKLVLNDVDLHPLHPDKAGGLRPLGQYALRTTYLIAFGGSMAAFAEYVAYINKLSSTVYFFHAAIVLYIFLAPLSFFAPLWAAHDAMSRAKDKLLLHIARQFKEDFSLAFNDIDGPSSKLKDNIEKIEQLQKLHQLAVSFPVWPFDNFTLSRFFLTISSPIATVVLTLLIEYLRELL